MIGAALVAALPMYDFPWVADAHDALWAAIARHLEEAGIDAPASLTRGRDLDALWGDPCLLFSQTCGYPYVQRLEDAVTLIAAPRYAFPGCVGAAHCSFLVAAKRDARRTLGEFRDARAAVNAWDSNSGMNLFRATLAPLANGGPFFGEVMATGAHERSLEAVVEGRADLAAIDCVSFALLSAGRPELTEAARVVAESPLSPALPFIASATLPSSIVEAVRAVLFAMLADDSLASARAALGLAGASDVTPETYERVSALEREAIAAGYPRLA
jgi:ABC-type phosphate/phosphonate transport system substrate-binding protein